MRRAGTYLRISEDRTGAGLAVDRQRQDCAHLITTRQWEAVDEYTDNDISAAGRRQRPAFERLMGDVEAGRIDTIVALSLDRLTRNRRDQLRLIETCQAQRVLVALVKGSDVDMTSAVGRAMADMMAVWARMEIEQKSERHKSQIQQAAKAGLPAGGPRAFGYKRGGMEIEPGEAAILRDLYQRFLAGAGLTELTLWLNHRKITTPRGCRWRPGIVRVVLANPRNAALRGMRPIINERTGSRQQYHDIIGPAVWPPIVDEATWRAVMTILRDPARLGRNHNPGGGAQPQHLLAGIAVCGRCKLPMTTSRGAKGVRNYRCSSKMHLTRVAEPLERWVTLTVFEWLRRPEAAHLLADVADADELDELRGQASVLRARMAELAAAFADGDLDREQLRVGSARLKSSLAAVEARIGELGQVDVVAPVVLADEVEQAWQTWSGYPTSTKRLVIQRLAHIEVLRGRLGRPPRGPNGETVFDPATVRLTWR